MHAEDFILRWWAIPILLRSLVGFVFDELHGKRFGDIVVAAMCAAAVVAVDVPHSVRAREFCAEWDDGGVQIQEEECAGS